VLRRLPRRERSHRLDIIGAVLVASRLLARMLLPGFPARAWILAAAWAGAALARSGVSRSVLSAACQSS
jgi:hypothetical protein